ncbi:XRE family transcriptional regulator (plasmid) [Clostridiaceae bacterium 14S0207]|nr:XRE family transcriptional regulator [Clostridiaceae bacterium 14S0207]
MNNDVGLRLKQLRKKLNLTQEQLGNKLCVSRSNIGNIEVGNVTLSERNTKDICELFNVNKNWLLHGDGEMFVTIDEDKELLEFVIRVLGNKNDFIKNTFLTLARLDEDEWQVVEKIIKSLQKK